MPELGPYGSVRGARGNSRPYRDNGVSGLSGPFLTLLGRWPRSARAGRSQFSLAARSLSARLPIFEKAYSQGHMRRRDFMSFVGATAVWPVAAHAQQLEDYVHNEGHIMVSVALNSFFSAAVAISGVYAVLKIGIQS